MFALLDTCISTCAALTETFGPDVTRWIGFACLFAIGWWKARRVQAVASAGIAVANESASKAKAEARAAHVQLAEIKGSLRPVALSMPPSSSSGTFEPVTMPELPDGLQRPRPSMPDPSLEDPPTLPRPSAVPVFDRETPAERPKGR